MNRTTSYLIRYAGVSLYFFSISKARGILVFQRFEIFLEFEEFNFDDAARSSRPIISQGTKNDNKIKQKALIEIFI